MKQYRNIIFDADHTLIDFDADERRAFLAAFREAGVCAGAEEVETCWAYSAKNWNDLGLNDVHLPAVQAGYHGMYLDHVRSLFDFVEQKIGLNGRRAAAQEAFMRELSAPSSPVEGAEETVRVLAGQYRVYVATNGLSAMQRSRLSAFLPFLSGLYISEEMGAIKPTRAFFDKMLRAIGGDVFECLMVGDSLSSDAAGAAAAGMDCVWFNRRGAARPGHIPLAGEIALLTELIPLLGGE